MADRNYFKGKRIAVIGLGVNGKMVEDAKFLIKAGALVSIYDLRSEARLRNHLVFLRSIGLANYVCGSVPADDLLDFEMIVLSHEYPRSSSFLAKPREKGIPIEYPETLFFKLAPPLTVVGVIGSAGKTTVMSMLAPMLEAVTPNLFVIDPESEGGIISHLKKAKNGDILLVRVTHAMMGELCQLRISPHVAIFTVLPHSYKSSPFEVLEHQTYNNFLIASDEIIDMTRSGDFKPKAKMLRTKTSIVPAVWELHLRPHEILCAALALQAARLFKISDDQAQKIVESWKPQRGRLEPVKKIKGVEFYNDTASESPNATVTSLRALSNGRNLLLIAGGGDTGLHYGGLSREIPSLAHTVILLPGSGTMKNRMIFESIEGVKVLSAPTMEEAVRLARERAKAGDKVLFSPAFAAAGVDASRKERGERFVRAVRAL